MKKLTKIIMSGAAVAAIGSTMAFGLVGCGGSDLEINISGSTSMEKLMGKLAEEYQKKYAEENDGAELTINVGGGGSGVGISDALAGKMDFGMASRPLDAEDADEKQLQSQTICLDGISIIVNENCTLTSVTKSQLVGLYIDGTAIGSVVAAISRESGSGTRDGFEEKLGIKGQILHSAPGFDEYGSTGEVLADIQENDAGNRIGYVSMGSVKGSVKALPYDAEDGSGAVEPTPANVLNGSYALSRPFVICYKSEDDLSELAKGFIDFIMSDEGQQICEEEGCISEVLHS